jgi:two-component system, OmpR family, phosphate regulon sensor histidine kinase PhoR
MGLRGAALAIGAVLAFITVPGLVAHGTDAVTLERLIVLPVVAGVGAASITAGLGAARAAQARAETREAELEAAMEVIERSRRSAHAIFEAVDVGLALLDRNGQPVLINHRLAEFSELAYPGGNVADGWVFDESGTIRLDIDAVPTSRARRGEEFDDVRVWVGKKEERRRAMSISARRVEQSDGSLVGAAISYTDVTDFMRALQVKDDFIALVSHELRTPLTSIIGYVAMDLEMDDLQPMLRKHLEIVARNAQRLERLVEGLLEEVEHSGRPMPLREQGTDLAAIVRDSVVAARPSATRAGVVLEVDAPDAIAFTGDPQRLAQVVDNLVSNAIKYTGSGGRAEVRASVDGARVVIRVRDTGIGIKPEDQAQLFTRFFRTREATLSAIQGVGLGLSISKSIVESHGGLIEVDSELGRGSEFRVVLPLHAARLAS